MSSPFTDLLRRTSHFVYNETSYSTRMKRDMSSYVCSHACEHDNNCNYNDHHRRRTSLPAPSAGKTRCLRRSISLPRGAAGCRPFRYSSRSKIGVSSLNQGRLLHFDNDRRAQWDMHATSCAQCRPQGTRGRSRSDQQTFSCINGPANQ